MRFHILGFLRGNVIALLALTVALGGTAFAASKVGGKDLKQIKVRSASDRVAAGDDVTVVRKCRKGEKYLSGGFDLGFVDEPAPTFDIVAAGPLLGVGKNLKATGYKFTGVNTGTERSLAVIYALCLKR